MSTTDDRRSNKRQAERQKKKNNKPPNRNTRADGQLVEEMRQEVGDASRKVVVKQIVALYRRACFEKRKKQKVGSNGTLSIVATYF
jgi:hypothetical protein